MLNVVLRDESLMKFVKYVSKDSPGSRVDVSLEVEVGEVGEDNGGHGS